MSRFSTGLKALRELGPRQLGLYARYQLSLRTGYLRWQAEAEERRLRRQAPRVSDRFLPNIPSREALAGILGQEGQAALLAEADEILDGRVRIFGGQPVPLRLSVPGPLAHWTEYERNTSQESQTSPLAGGSEVTQPVRDIKMTWEPGRFGWAFTLARAYLVSGDERYPEAFWDYTQAFLDANPPQLGPYWTSAQEVALRLMALACARQVFALAQSTTTGREASLVQAIAQHAARIPPSLDYARSQHNNHLLTEAAGLYTAGLLLAEHPSARRWRRLGWKWFNDGLQRQIAKDGTYAQHSTNYQRLMLQAALWVFKLGLGEHGGAGRPVFPEASRLSLAAATNWLLDLVDPATGRVPNLGPNDGAYIFPFSTCPIGDYRPVLQAAGQAFLGKCPFPAGPWDEMLLWFTGGQSSQAYQPAPTARRPGFPSPHILRSKDDASWAYLRAVHFTSRPGHADQLHLDLWWQGWNIAQDAGTYLYNAPSPWDNALAGSMVHNTVTVNGQDQMTRAGRFLYLDWAQAKIMGAERDPDGRLSCLVAQHDGYRKLGVLHRRTVSCDEGVWLVVDRLLPASGRHLDPVTARVQWLLPDWHWDLKDTTLNIQSPGGWITLQITGETLSTVEDVGAGFHPSLQAQLVRAGELLAGSGPVFPTWGWAAPVYGEKQPALSFSVQAISRLPLSFTSRWALPPATNL